MMIKQWFIWLLMTCFLIRSISQTATSEWIDIPENTPDQINETVRETQEMDQLSISNNGLSVSIEIKSGIILKSIYDEVLQHEYIIRPQALFVYRIGENTYTSEKDIEVSSAKKGDKEILLQAKSRTHDLEFELNIRPDPENSAIQIDFSIKNDNSSAQYVMLTYPSIQMVKIPGDARDSYASVPQEIGWVGKYDTASTMGFVPSDTVGLPTGQNVMEVISVYNRKNLGGMFIADINGAIDSDISPINMVLNKGALEGFCVAQLESREVKQLATIAIGLIHDNDWHAAVDYYTRYHRPNWEFPEIPNWLREAGAVYSAKNAGAGGCYMLLPEVTDLRGRIGNFVSLPILLKEAQAMGTNVVFVSDYYDKADIRGERITPVSLYGAVASHYWNKGDYIPREDLGGAEAFKRGIKNLHDAGGKIIVYVEPYVTLYFSNIGREKGELWAARNPDGSLDMSYPYNYTMCSALSEWRKYICDVCIRLVQEYDVDGIFLDSMGWQWNHNYMTLADNHVYSLKEYNDGFLAMTAEVRQVIKEIKPDAVVLSETGGGPLVRYNDGGWTADFAWGKTVSNPIIISSPLRYAIPEANIYSNGDTISHLKQVYAAGFSLALSYHWEEHKEYIKKLVELRQQYKDAMIYGRQEYQPETENQYVAAYLFKGEQNTIVTLMNARSLTYNGNVELRSEYGNTAWVDELTGEVLTADDNGQLMISLPPQELMILRLRN